MIPKTLTIYNASEESVYLESIKGIQLYEKGSGPQNFGAGKYPPNYFFRMTTWQTVFLKFPVEIRWSLNGSAATFLSEFNEVAGLDKSTLTKEGNILLVFETNNIWSIKYVDNWIITLPELEERYRK